MYKFSSVQSCPTLFDPMNHSIQVSLSITSSWSLLKLMSFESVMPSNHLILCRPLLLLPSIFPSNRLFSNESVFASVGQNIGASASASVLPMNIQDWSPSEWTGWISLQSKGLSRVFNTTQFKSINSLALSLFMVQLSYPYMTTGKAIGLTIWAFVCQIKYLLFNMLSFLIAFLPRSKCL